jgi:pyruvate dehydrogenase E1 component alpha subunit
VTSLADAVARVHAADRALTAARPAPFPVPASGLEAVIAGSVSALGRGDWWVPGLRERVGAVLRDVPLDRLADGFRGARPYKVAPPTPSPALRALHAVGLALSAPGRCALVHLGIGSMADGAVHEALNLAALHGAHVIFVVADVPLGHDAPIGRQLAADVPTLAAAFGLSATTVDGTDPDAVHAAVSAARAAAGPHLVHAVLPRPTETSR